MNLYLIFFKHINLICFFLFLFFTNANSESVTNIAIVFDGPSEINQLILDSYKKEIKELTKGEFIVNFPESKTIEADWSVKGVNDAVNKMLQDPSVDILITPGVLSSINVIKRRKLAKPVIAPVIIDNQLIGAPSDERGASGVNNLTYLSSSSVIGRDFRIFKDVVWFKKLAFLYMPIILESVPEVKDIVSKSARDIGVEIVMVPAGNNIDEIFNDIPNDVDAVYITPLLQMSDDNFRKLVQGLTYRKLPSFSLIGTIEVEEGVLIGLNPKENLPRQSRRVALNVQSILLGENAGTLPVSFPRKQQLTINMKTARAIGFYPAWEVYYEADLLNEKDEMQKNIITLTQAVNEAVNVNLDLLASERFVLAGAQEVRKAIAILLPQSEISLDASIIDEDRALASRGIQPERTLTGSANVNQLIFSESAWSNLRVQKYNQSSRELSRDEIKLDIISATAIAYLIVLRDKTFEKIQKSNLQLTRSNLEIAESRKEIGVANPAEVFRWESQVAGDKISVVDAESQTKNAEILLKRLLNRPLNEKTGYTEVKLNDPFFNVGDPRLTKYIDNPGSFEIFKDFMVEEGFNQSPEIKNIDSQINAQDRILLSTKHAFWLPEFSFFGEVNERFKEGGEGQRDDFNNIPEISNLDDTEWTLLFRAKFPLTRGGAKIADYKQAREELFRLRLERDSTIEKIEQETRSSLNDISASYPSIKFSNDAAISSSKNLDIVTDSYSRGVVSILDLLDAQNSSLSADLNAATAVYDFLIDFVLVERSVGRFYYFISKEQRDEWFDRLDLYFKNIKFKTSFN